MSPERSSGQLRVLELYCGIGGCATALGEVAEQVTAVDVNRLALSVYSRNFAHLAVPALVESLPIDRLKRWNADLWWMSPPCQPFTQRGRQRDIEDPRARTFLALLERIAAVRPTTIACENVPPFRHSKVRERLLDTLDRSGYETVRETVLCPTDFGIPNRRRRYYLIASRDSLRPPQPPIRKPTRLSQYLDSAPSPDLTVDPALVARFRGALHVVRADDPEAVTQCFTSAYGRSPVRSGSYCAEGSGIRHFSPREILRLLGFPPTFHLPETLSLRKSWRLVANSLSIVPVRHVLGALPAWHGALPGWHLGRHTPTPDNDGITADFEADARVTGEPSI